MTASLPARLSLFARWLLLLACFLLPVIPDARAEEQNGCTAKRSSRIIDDWGEMRLVLSEPVVSATVVENGKAAARVRDEEEEEDEDEGEEGEEHEPFRRFTPEELGLDLFSVKGSPAPKLRWTDQNQLSIAFAPGTSPNTDYAIVFKPQVHYLGGAPLEERVFVFRCKPVQLRAYMLQDYAGGAALISAVHADTKEAQQLAENHAGLRLCFRRMREIPMVGEICTGTVPARLRPATLGDGIGGNREALQALLRRHKPESVREDMVLPQCLLALPEEPLTPGAHYEIGVEAAPGSGFRSGNYPLHASAFPEHLRGSLSAGEVVPASAREKAPHVTRFKLTFNQPVPAEQLHALWAQLGIRTLSGEGKGVAARQEDGSYLLQWTPRGGADEAAPAAPVQESATLRLRSLLPCGDDEGGSWYPEGQGDWNYAPAGCAAGMEIELNAATPVELELTLPPLLTARHGLNMGGKPQRLHLSAMPACPVLTGNGSNELALYGEHRLRLPFINVGSVTATARHWDAESAARLLPLIQRGMRDDTSCCELLARLFWLRRRADEGLPTEGAREDKRTAAGRALRLLREDWEQKEPLRARALAQATTFPTVELPMQGQMDEADLVRKGECLLDLEELTGGRLRPGLYLITLTSTPDENVRRALANYREEAGAETELASCTVDYLVQVTDLSPRLVATRHLVVNSMATGEPMEGVQASAYVLPQVSDRETEEEEGDDDALAAEAAPMRAGAEGKEGDALAPCPMKQGELELPRSWEGKLVLLRRGEDYCLFSLACDRFDESEGDDEDGKPLVELFCDRPLYRPGETVHLRGVLRCPVKGGLALPKGREVQLRFFKPNDEEMELRKVVVDAYGAFATDFSLPVGEEDVTGEYRCKLMFREGGDEVETELSIPCEVFRRDAFKATLTMELDPVAPNSYRAALQATDYNGTPVAGGKVDWELTSTAPLLDEDGRRPEGVATEDGEDRLEGTLTLDAEGCAEWRGKLGAFTKEGQFTLEVSVANDREEYVELQPVSKRLSPTDFVVLIDSSARLRLLDASTEEHKPLARAQELQLSLMAAEKARRELPSGLYERVEKERELVSRRITVPANCTQGIDLAAALKDAAADGGKLVLTGRDAAGRELRYERRWWPSYGEKGVDGKNHFGTLTAEGRKVFLKGKTPFAKAGRVHVFVRSQGRLRHALIDVQAGEDTVCLPLEAQEYGQVAVTALCCGMDDWGCYRNWSSVADTCLVARPDKALAVELTLPQGLKPGAQATLQGRVVDAGGKPTKAAVTLFAIDAGMMSIASYTLPDMAANFYEGSASSVELSGSKNRISPISPPLIPLPCVWNGSKGYWLDGLPAAGGRSVYPMQLRTRSLLRGIGSLCHENIQTAVHRAQPDFRWGDIIDSLFGQQMQYAPAPAPVTVEKAAADEDDEAAEEEGCDGGHRAYGKLNSLVSGFVGEDLEEHVMSATFVSYCPPLGEGGSGLGAALKPRLRKNFAPVALWLASLETAEDGSFTTTCTLPDTLTTYRVFAVALSADGESFGKAEGEFLVNQPLMLTAGTPFFMSCGDKLLLPLTVTNNTDEAGRWNITLSGAGDTPAQAVELAARSTATLYFEVVAGEEGESVLQWTASSDSGADAVEGRFPVRYPAPLLKEAHRFVVEAGGEGAKVADMLAAEVAAATRGSIELQYSTSPLLHLAGSLDFLLTYPYGCTEQRSSALLPWLLYDRLAPFCPQMALTPADEARKIIDKSIAQILARQQKDGGLSYWMPEEGEEAESCPWASAYAALVLTIAQEQGIAVPEDAMEKLRGYLRWKSWDKDDHLTQYAAARARGKDGEVNRILVRALRKELENKPEFGFRGEFVDLEFIAQLRSNPVGRHAAFLQWMKSRARDARHRAGQSSWRGGWCLIALSEYLRLEPKASGTASVSINGEAREVEAEPGSMRFQVGEGQRLCDIAPQVTAGNGTVYVAAKVKAQPEQTEYPGVTEKGLQVTRVYEVKDAEGKWREATEFKVGDIVRVTLTCAKVAPDVEYFVLEDYLPACMEAINPRVPGQAAGLDDGGWGRWSEWFDHKEYLADRVRGFCTRWSGRELINMSYYARVKRAGESMAAPAEAQLMYEPQTYGLSPNVRVQVR